MIELHTTEYLGCPYAKKLILQNPDDVLLHLYNIRGTLAHKIFENHLRDENFKIDDYDKFIRDSFPDIPKEVYNICIIDLPKIEQNFLKWRENTKLDLSNPILEQEMKVSIHDKNYIQLMTPDFYNNKYILDFKTGKTFLEHWKNQVADYWYALGKKHEVYIIQINDEWYKEIKITKLLNLFMENHRTFKYFIKEINKDIPERKRNSCGFCSVRHRCFI